MSLFYVLPILEKSSCSTKSIRKLYGIHQAHFDIGTVQLT